MELAVRQYEIQYQPITPSWGKKLAAFFAVVFFMIGFRWGIEYLFHWEHLSGLGALFVPIALGVCFARRPFQCVRGGSLIVGDDFVERRTQIEWFTAKKRIRRDQIKSISENWRGLRIKDRSGFGAFIAGFVFVPATMPEYQEVKAVFRAMDADSDSRLTSRFHEFRSIPLKKA